MNTEKIRKHLFDTISDSLGRFLYYDRKEDPELPRGAIEALIEADIVTLDEIVDAFVRGLQDSLGRYSAQRKAEALERVEELRKDGYGT